VRSYTILDYLYRLRIKANYQDAGMFIDGPEDESASRRVHRDLVTIASCTLLVHECHIGGIVGKTQMGCAGSTTGWGHSLLVINSGWPGAVICSGSSSRSRLSVRHHDDASSEP